MLYKLYLKIKVSLLSQTFFDDRSYSNSSFPNVCIGNPVS